MAQRDVTAPKREVHTARGNRSVIGFRYGDFLMAGWERETGSIAATLAGLDSSSRLALGLSITLERVSKALLQ